MNEIESLISGVILGGVFGSLIAGIWGAVIFAIIGAAILEYIYLTDDIPKCPDCGCTMELMKKGLAAVWLCPRCKKKHHSFDKL